MTYLCVWALWELKQSQVSLPRKASVVAGISVSAVIASVHTDTPGWKARSLGDTCFHSPTSADPRADPTPFTLQIEIDQLCDMGQFATLEDAEPLVVTALASLCQEAHDFSSAGRGRRVRHQGHGEELSAEEEQGPGTPPWALSLQRACEGPTMQGHGPQRACTCSIAQGVSHRPAAAASQAGQEADTAPPGWGAGALLPRPPGPLH